MSFISDIFNPDEPDYSGINDSARQNAELGREWMGLAREELGAARQRQAQFDPLYRQIIQDSLAASRTATERGDQQWAQYRDVFMPMERELAATAANYDTAGRRASAAAEASADVSRNFQASREAQQRNLGRAGVSMSSGRALTLDRASRFAEAKAAAGAEGNARRAVETTGLQLKQNVVNTGRGIASTGLAAAGQGVSYGGAAAGTLGGQQSAYGASLAPAFQGFGSAGSAFNSSGNLAATMAQLQTGQQGNAMQGLAGLGNLAGTAYMMFGQQPSSKKLKTNKRQGLGYATSSKEAKKPRATNLGDAALEGIRRLPPVEGWDYKPGVADEGTHIGEYAEDAQREFGDGVAPGGKVLDMRAADQRNKLAIGALAKKMDHFERLLTELEAAAA